MLECLKKLDAEQIIYCLSLKLSKGEVAKERPENLLAFIENSDKSPENKWYWYQAIQHPEQLRDQLVSLLERVFELYQPIYEQFEQEVLAFEREFSLSDVMDDEEQNAKLFERTHKHLFCHPCLLTLFSKRFLISLPLVLSTRSSQLSKAESELNDETLAQTLKTLGDETRYKVLIELIQPHAKNKDIAKNWGLQSLYLIPYAEAPKFWLAELVVDDDSVKYTVNKELIQKIIEKFKQDLT